MTPVELGRTAPCGQPRSRAVSAQTRSAASAPPGAHTFEILLLTMIAASDGPASLARPTMTGAPGNAFFVNTAAKSGVGRSSAMSVSVILAGLGASAGVKSKREAPTRNPAGSADCVASHARCAVRSAKVVCVLDMDRELWPRSPGVKPNIFAARRKLLWKCKPTLL